jgi:hypothetical protein
MIFNQDLIDFVMEFRKLKLSQVCFKIALKLIKDCLKIYSKLTED